METASTPLPSKILFGLVVFIAGLLVSLGLLYFFIFNKDQSNSTNKQILTLEISSPETALATSGKTITVTGTTRIKSVVTVNSPQKSTVIDSNDGKFATEVALLEGKNIIAITAFDPSTGQSQTSQREVLYLSEELDK